MILLEYCTSDLESGSGNGGGETLHGIPLIPLSNGKIGTFTASGMSAPIMVTTNLTEVALMIDVVPEVLVDPAMVEKHAVLSSKLVLESTQLEIFNHMTSLPALLPLIYPAKACGKKEVMWNGKSPTREWIQILWKYLKVHPDAIETLTADSSTSQNHQTFFPIVPTKQPKASTLMALRRGMSAVTVDALKTSDAGRLAMDDDALTIKCLCRVGVRCVDPTLVESFAAIEKHVQVPTAIGVLESIHNIIIMSPIKAQKEAFLEVNLEELEKTF